MTDRRGRRRVLSNGALAVLTVVALAACDPMPHTNFTQRAAPAGGANLTALAENGRYVVVTATAGGPVVPGAGNWRVDRTTGDTLQLPAGTVDRISADGSRVLLGNSGVLVLWNNGATSSPSGTLSQDLTARAFIGGDGTVQTQDLASGVVRAVEAAFPRPPGTSAQVVAVSDDGDTVVFRFDATIRVIDLGAGAFVDIPSLSADGDGSTPPTTESIVLAADGGALARSTQTVACDVFQCQQFAATIDWIGLPTGTVLGHYENATQEFPIFTRISDNGRAVWSYQERVVMDGTDPFCPSLPHVAFCAVSASLVELSVLGVRVDAIGPGMGLDLRASANGRFAVLSREQPGYRGLMPAVPVRVVDALSSGPRWETLTGGPSPSTGAWISGNGRVISTSSETGGWYDFEA